MSEPYVPGDYCDTCDQPFELCGHMSPETPDTEADHADAFAAIVAAESAWDAHVLSALDVVRPPTTEPPA